MSCCIPETFHLLCALMAERGGIWSRFTSRVLENPAAWLLHRQGVTSTDKGKPCSAPSSGQEGTQPQPPRGCCGRKGGWVVCRESSSALAHSAEHQSHLPARRHNLTALFAASSLPARLLCPPDSPPAAHPAVCPALSSCSERDAGSRKACERAGALPPAWILTVMAPAPPQCCIPQPPPHCSPPAKQQPAQDPRAGGDRRD